MTDNWTLEEGCVPYAHVMDTQELYWYGHTLQSFKRLIAQSNSASNLMKMFYRPVLKNKGKRIWIEKSPPNIYGMLAFLDTYPDGKGIIIVRDGRDVLCSLQKRGLSLGSSISIWLIETALSLVLAKSPLIHLVRYEDLVFSTRETLAKITDFLEVGPAWERLSEYTTFSSRNAEDPRDAISTWQNTPFDGIQSASVGRWKHELREEELGMFYAHRIAEGGDKFPIEGMLHPLTTIDLLRALSYDVPDAVAFSWTGMIRFLETESHPIAHVTGTGGLHRRNTVLSVPREIQVNVSAQRFMAILEECVRKYVVSQESAVGKERKCVSFVTKSFEMLRSIRNPERSR